MRKWGIPGSGPLVLLVWRMSCQSSALVFIQQKARDKECGESGLQVEMA